MFKQAASFVKNTIKSVFSYRLFFGYSRLGDRPYINLLGFVFFSKTYNKAILDLEIHRLVIDLAGCSQYISPELLRRPDVHNAAACLIFTGHLPEGFIQNLKESLC